MEGVIGYTTLFAGNFAPKNWEFCQGQLIAIRSNTALFSILGTTYGGDGVTTFALPDLRSRAVVGAGNGPGLSPYSLGEQAGGENTVMQTNQLPPHQHPVNGHLTPGAGGAANSASPAGSVYATSASSLYNATGGVFMLPYNGAITSGPNGNGNSFSTLQPVLALNYVVCLYGTFPSRN